MKTLYVSDLDGTLLRKNATLSEYTKSVINRLIENGMLFSYATARSCHTALKVAGGLKGKIPIITYNGAVTLQNHTYELISKNIFGVKNHEHILYTLLSSGVYPIVYSYADGQDRYSYLAEKCNAATIDFIMTQESNVRRTPVTSDAELSAGEVFYFTCIDSYEKLAPLYEKFRDTYNCFFQKDIYCDEQFLEIIPKSASKANAVLWLKEHLGADRVVAFGDGKNDIDMFRIADEAYAVENAAAELKAISNGVIGSNESDGVAKWLDEHNFSHTATADFSIVHP